MERTDGDAGKDARGPKEWVGAPRMMVPTFRGDHPSLGWVKEWAGAHRIITHGSSRLPNSEVVSHRVTHE